MSLRGTLSHWINSTVINKYGESAVVEIETVFWPVYQLPVKRLSETGLFRHLSNHIFRSPLFPKHISYGVHLFLKYFQIWCRVKKFTKNFEKVFCFLDKCTWIGRSKLSLLRRKDLSSAVGVLKNRLNTLDVTKRHSFRLNYLQNDQWIW